MMLKTVNQRLALIFAGLAVTMIYLSFQLPEYAFVPVDSDMMPKLLGITLLVLSIIFYFSKDTDTDEQKAKRTIPKQEAYMLLIVLVLILIYITLLEIVGFIPMTIAFIISCSRLLGFKNWLVNILTSITFSGGVYYLFNELLSIRLPSGIVPF
ncbi:tripartite tricarboxylate transporter TctB family protein [Alkalicoccobacillus plakortidis]|uniref:Tripartite tricarboxylate transporter TctB family protein n=1 Tax=Alkalicoccobacillus plakortidis TaxID=444060 RepID=A0ABT0XNU6_9BACI|nr:tripartite tricarboxylate transporter TctB family protein [Alkalicoccobacillus plakortidis]MCM2676934.1 tripartite tricarboxylate transporter TctB family protein [Alkalicoccobacillus plakortidis]